jgi:5-methylcytosine-specific restriction endonuclease McrA
MAKTRDPRSNHRRRDRHRAHIARGKPPCAFCGEDIDYTLRFPHPDSYEVDHIIPIVQGGADHVDNLAPSHRRCNRAAGDKRPRHDTRPAVTYVTDRTWTVGGSTSFDDD